MLPDPILLPEILDNQPAELPAWMKTAFLVVLAIVGVIAATVVADDVFDPPARPACWQGMQIGSARKC